MIENLLSKVDYNNLKSDNIINIQIMREDFKLKEKDISILLDNVFTLYDAGISKYKIPGDKHGAFLLLTMHKYYNFIVDYMCVSRDKHNGEIIFSPKRIEEKDANRYVQTLYKM